MGNHPGAKYTSFEAYEQSIETTAADEYFVDLVQRNPEVCSNCFVKLRDVWFPHDTALSKRGKHTETWKGLTRYFLPKRDRTESATVAFDDDEPARNPPLSCTYCGSIASATRRPLAFDDAVDYAWNLSQTLAEFDVEHNPLVLGFVVAHRKRFPQFGSCDDDTFAIAVEYAVDETDHTIADVVEGGGVDDPAWSDDVPLDPRPPLPPAGDARPTVRHGTPALFTTDDE